jgi:hypothetical protein
MLFRQKLVKSSQKNLFHPLSFYSNISFGAA